MRVAVLHKSDDCRHLLLVHDLSDYKIGSMHSKTKEAYRLTVDQAYPMNWSHIEVRLNCVLIATESHANCAFDCFKPILKEQNIEINRL